MKVILYRFFSAFKAEVNAKYQNIQANIVFEDYNYK